MLTAEDIELARSIVAVAPEQATALDRIATHAERALLAKNSDAYRDMQTLRLREYSGDVGKFSEDQRIADTIQSLLGAKTDLEAEVERLGAAQ